MKKYEVIGMMSGTSLDGLDIAYVQFWFDNQWHFKTCHCESLDYTSEWKQRLSNAISLSGLELKELDLEYGTFLGESVKKFIIKYEITPDLIVSHGHTIFHQPDKGLTLQIGDGYRILEQTDIKTICDLRSRDISLGGQGAPLVPIGDQLLFGQYEYCLNLGGFSNISFDQDNERIAFDICPVNTVLNHLSTRMGYEFDKNGEHAKSGKLIPGLLETLNKLEYYHTPPPKSLGIEWVNANIFPLLNDFPTEDLLSTFCFHISEQIINTCQSIDLEVQSKPKILITGGGAKNDFLIDLLKQKSSKNLEIIIPETDLIDFKEAIIFAFLGLLKDQGQNNCLKSVTGAKSDSSGGTVFI